MSYGIPTATENPRPDGMMNRGGSSMTIDAAGGGGGGALPMFRLIPKSTLEASTLEYAMPVMQAARITRINLTLMTFSF